MQFPVYIGLHRSRFLFLLLSLFHLIAAACVVVLPWPWFLQTVVLLFLAVSAWLSTRPSKIIGLSILSSERMDCRFADGSRHQLSLLSDSTVFSHLIVLRLKLGEASRTTSLTLLPDQMSANEFRVLSLWLRWRSVTKIRVVKSL
jgi:hypothetical protein